MNDFIECEFRNELFQHDVKPWFIHYCRTLFSSDCAFLGESWDEAAIRLFRNSDVVRVHGISQDDIDAVLRGDPPPSSICRAMQLVRVDSSDVCERCGSLSYSVKWRFNRGAPLLPKF
jgi:hypothetical protein